MEKFGSICFHLCVRATVRHGLEGEEEVDEIRTYQEAVQAAVAHMEIDKRYRNVLIAHQFVVGAMRCDSEEISVGGIDPRWRQMCSGILTMWHLAISTVLRMWEAEHIRYCGTPLKYSFSEAGQQKSVTVVELLEKGNLRIREIPLKPLRDMRKLKGTYMEITSLSSYQDTNTEDYVQITLTDEEDIVDGMQKLRTIYPNLMRLEYDNRRTRENQEIAGTETVKRKSEAGIF